MIKNIIICFGFFGCSIASDNQSFSPPETRPAPVGQVDVMSQAMNALRESESLLAAAPYAAHGMGRTVVQVVVTNIDGIATSFVLDDAGQRVPSEKFWRDEKTRQYAAYGKMSPELFYASRRETGYIEVEFTLAADLPEPVIPYDGKDRFVAVDEYRLWFSTHSQNQQQRLAQQRKRLTGFLRDAGADGLIEYNGLPIVKARVPAALLASPELHRADVLGISTPTEARAIASKTEGDRSLEG